MTHNSSIMYFSIDNSLGNAIAFFNDAFTTPLELEYRYVIQFITIPKEILFFPISFFMLTISKEL